MHMPGLWRAATLALMVAACSETPTGLDDHSPQFDFGNGPADLTNVVRTLDGYQGVGFYDAETNLWLFAAPFWPACGAPQSSFGLHTSVQEVGVLREAVNTLQMGRIFLYVFSGDYPGSMCQNQLLGEGVGQFMYTDNDKYGSGTRTATWSWRMNGQLQLVQGGTASLVAVFRYALRDGQSLEHAHVIRLSRLR